jgi:transaldolase
MIKEGEELAAIDDNIVVKIPMTKDGLRAISYFTAQGIRTNCTLIFSAGQALMAAKAGASYVSPFVGRLDDVSTDGMVLIEDIVDIFSNFGYDTEVLAASIRHPMHIIDCAKIGADVITAPLSVILSLIKHPLTDVGLEKFMADAKKLSV